MISRGLKTDFHTGLMSHVRKRQLFQYLIRTESSVFQLLGKSSKLEGKRIEFLNNTSHNNRREARQSHQITDTHNTPSNMLSRILNKTFLLSKCFWCFKLVWFVGQQGCQYRIYKYKLYLIWVFIAVRSINSEELTIQNATVNKSTIST